MISIALIAALTAGPTCHFVSGDRITGADLTAAVPELSAIPTGAVIGFAPQPGSVRRFRPDEMARILAHYGVRDVTAPEVCFAWKMRPVAKDAAKSAMQRAFSEVPLKIDLKEIRPELAPEGELVFLRRAFPAPAPGRDNTVEWRGDVVYAPGRKFTITAKVAVAVASKRVVAVEPLKQGVPLTASSLRLETYEEAPGQPAPAVPGIDELEGWLPRRNIPAGSVVRISDLMRPLDIARGGLAQVEVRAGSARLLLEARAEVPGRIGDVIPFKNPASGKTFLARVDAKGKAVLVMKGVQP